MSEYVANRRAATAKRLEELRSGLGDAAKTVENRACAYVTGSFGRLEAGRYSDLDLFIVGRSKEDRRELPRLDEICVKADLIEITRKHGFPDFSGDGEYLEHYTVRELVKTLGRAEDDMNNTFTARLLLLLESKPLIGDAVYSDAINDVIAAYWGDFEDHKTEFVPAFLVNDILRLWRTFCVNYEARTSREPDEKKAKRRLKNYKLKHSRLMTCYSGIAFLLAVFAAGKTVTPRDAREMVSLTPVERIEALASRGVDPQIVAGVIASYEKFLKNTDDTEDALVAKFLDRDSSKRCSPRRMNLAIRSASS